MGETYVARRLLITSNFHSRIAKHREKSMIFVEDRDGHNARSLLLPLDSHLPLLFVLLNTR